IVKSFFHLNVLRPFFINTKETLNSFEDNTTPTTKKLSEKYRGMLSKEDGKLLNEHIEKMRSEWSSI
ncbi:MAG: hypothetical protein KKG00_03750, partial [Bacteroidetes bacterium]|nr:hypothetical protein [Bacteroidota bacterium]